MPSCSAFDKTRIVMQIVRTIRRTIRQLFAVMVDYSMTIRRLFAVLVDYLPSIRRLFADYLQYRLIFADYSYYSHYSSTFPMIQIIRFTILVLSITKSLILKQS